MQEQLNSSENRKSFRESFKIPVQLEIQDLKQVQSDSPKIIFGHTINISRSGVGLLLAGSDSTLADIGLILNIDTPTAQKKIPAKMVWNNSTQCGLRFHQELEDIEHLLNQTATPFLFDGLKIKKFYPFVNGQDVDTKKYEFFPYADKFITDYKTVREMMVQLKRGGNPVGIESYFYAQYAVANSELNQAAVLAAHRAFQEFKNFSVSRRKKILEDIRELLLQEKENLIQLMIIEGHPRKLAEWEFYGMYSAHMKESLDYFESELIKTVGQTGDETVLLVRRPEGVICVCPPKNSSGSISLMASFALLAGNTIVIKPPLQMPISTIYLWRNIVGKALKENSAPKGTVNIVIGNSKNFLEEWLENSYVRCVFFFGDSKLGLEVGNRIFEKGKKPILELSGNDYMVVWKDAPIEEATNSLLDCFMGSTQICMVPKKALIHEDIYPQFVKVFLEKVKKLKVGLPSDPETILSPVVKIKEFYEHLNDAIQNGGDLLMGGHRLNHRGEKDPEGFYISPTVVQVPMERVNMMKCINEETFFPLLPIIKVTGGGLTVREKDHKIFKEMVNLVEMSPYGLRLSIWVGDPFYVKKFVEEMHHSGLLRINSRHINFSPYLSPNGGIGKSGGPFGEMNYIWQKTSHLQGISVTKLNPKSPISPLLKVVKENIDKN